MRTIVKELLQSNINALANGSKYGVFYDDYVEDNWKIAYLLEFSDLIQQLELLIQRVFINPEIILQPRSKAMWEKRLLEKPNIEKLKQEYPKETLENKKATYQQLLPNYPFFDKVFEGKYEEVILEGIQNFEKKSSDSKRINQAVISYLFIEDKFEEGFTLRDKYITDEWSLHWLSLVELIEKSKTSTETETSKLLTKNYPLGKRNETDNLNLAISLSGLLNYNYYPCSD